MALLEIERRQEQASPEVQLADLFATLNWGESRRRVTELDREAERLLTSREEIFWPYLRKRRPNAIIGKRTPGGCRLRAKRFWPDLIRRRPNWCVGRAALERWQVFQQSRTFRAMQLYYRSYALPVIGPITWMPNDSPGHRDGADEVDDLMVRTRAARDRVSDGLVEVDPTRGTAGGGLCPQAQ